MSFTPREYQVDAINSIVNCFKDHDRTTAVMACGTGKTLVALWVAEHLQAKTILVLMPSLMLIKQTIDVWMAENKWPLYKFMVICCDDTLLEDDIQLETKDCCFDICINREQINRFATSEFDGVKIIFSTYTSSSVIPSTIQFDLSIFDEAHKTAHKDADCFGYALHDKNVHSKKRLFITATPRHYRLRKSQEKLEYSMDNEKVYGPICYCLSFSDAIRLGIICDYKIVITLMDKSKLEDYNLDNKLIKLKNKQISLKQIAHAISLLQIYKDTKVTRSVTFHSSIKDAQLFTSLASYIFTSKKNNTKCLHINGTMDSFERTVIMNDFEKTKHSTISNARCLSEGVDIPAIDLVAFMAPKRSTIDIIQAIGRVMRMAPGKEYGYVFLPLYIDNQKDANQLTSNPEYSYVIDIINSLREYDPELQQTINDIILGKACSGTYKIDKIQFINANITQKQLAESIKVKILAASFDNWENNFERLKDWHQKTRSFVFPLGLNAEEFKLAKWARSQRTLVKEKILRPDRVKRLMDTGFPLDIRDQAWLENLANLDDYIRITGLDDLSLRDKNLANWFFDQRDKYVLGTLRNDRRKLLTELFEKYGLKENLTIKYRCRSRTQVIHALVSYYEKNKSWISVLKDDKRLYDYLMQHSWDDFNPEETKLLQSINAPISQKNYIRTMKWDKMFDLAHNYKEKFGTLVFCQRKGRDYPGLGEWLKSQRSLAKQKTLPKDRYKKLNKLGLFKQKTWEKND